MTKHTQEQIDSAIELVKDRTTKEPFGVDERIGVKIYKQGLEKNLLLRPLGSIIYFFLPLCVTEEELDDIFSRAKEVIRPICEMVHN